MQHGNKKYDFEPLKNIGGETVVHPANIYSLKSALRQYLELSTKLFKFDDAGHGKIRITRIA